MASPAAPFREAVETALRASSALSAAMGGTIRLYTEVPTNAPLPYVVIGQTQVIHGEADACAEEKELFETVTLWSRATPLDHGAQARAMGAAVLDALAALLTVADWTVDLWEIQSEQYLTDPDKSTKGVLVLRYLLTQQVA